MKQVFLGEYEQLENILRDFYHTSEIPSQVVGGVWYRQQGRENVLSDNDIDIAVYHVQPDRAGIQRISPLVTKLLSTFEISHVDITFYYEDKFNKGSRTIRFRPDKYYEIGKWKRNKYFLSQPLRYLIAEYDPYKPQQANIGVISLIVASIVGVSLLVYSLKHNGRNHKNSKR